mmetsp:Transcript_52356/g.81639  ORF Transcript_52356/g.81639 Transcript_52356/m.81639 type:complete len:87 (-) Transcript_52356:14-274(-)
MASVWICVRGARVGLPYKARQLSSRFEHTGAFSLHKSYYSKRKLSCPLCGAVAAMSAQLAVFKLASEHIGLAKKSSAYLIKGYERY